MVAIVIVLASVLLIAVWYAKRKYFPLRERSPYLVILFTLGNMLYLLSYPSLFLYLLKYKQIAPISGGIEWKDLDFVARSLANCYYVGIEYHDHLLLRAVHPIALSIAHYLRASALRLSYAFNPKRERRLFDAIYSRQWLLCLVRFASF